MAYPYTVPNTFTNGPTQTIDATQVNANFNALLAAVNAASLGATGLLSARPVASAVPVGSPYFATDDWGGTLYITDGAAWQIAASRNTKTVTFSAAASATISGLDGDTQELFELWVRASYSVAGVDLVLQCNTDTTVGNYESRRYGMGGSGTVVTRSSSASAAGIILAEGGLCSGAPAAGALESQGTLAAKTGVHRQYRGRSSAYDGTGLGSGDHVGRWANTANNLTQVALLPATGNFTGTAVLRRVVTP